MFNFCHGLIMSAVAFIKILEGVDRGKKKRISINEIDPKLEGIDYDASKKYFFEGQKMRIIDTACKLMYFDLNYFIRSYLMISNNTQ